MIIFVHPEQFSGEGNYHCKCLAPTRGPLPLRLRLPVGAATEYLVRPFLAAEVSIAKILGFIIIQTISKMSGANREIWSGRALTSSGQPSRFPDRVLVSSWKPPGNWWRSTQKRNHLGVGVARVGANPVHWISGRRLAWYKLCQSIFFFFAFDDNIKFLDLHADATTVALMSASLPTV
jgi:hypothetical protein